MDCTGQLASRGEDCNMQLLVQPLQWHHVGWQPRHSKALLQSHCTTQVQIYCWWTRIT
jgi:hypothetical protein